MFSASLRLKLPKSSIEQIVNNSILKLQKNTFIFIIKKVNNYIKDLGLIKCQNNKIGGILNRFFLFLLYFLIIISKNLEVIINFNNKIIEISI